MIVSDLSIDGAPVDPLDSIGGPAFVGSAWLGSFPQPTSFSVSMLADLRSRNLHGDASLVGSFVPEPSALALIALAALGAVSTRSRGKRRRGVTHRGPVATSIVLLVSASSASGAMFNANNVAELISAINSANQNAEPDSIALATGTTFTLTLANTSTNGPTGLPVISASESLSIFGNGSIIERSAAAETPAFRLFDVAVGAALTLENLTLQGGHLYGSQVLTGEASAKGGAIYNQGDLVMHNVTVEGNTALGHIGTYSRGFSAAGGGVYSSGSFAMRGGAIQNNLAQGGLGGHSFVGRDGATPGGPGGHGWGGGLYVAGGTATLNEVALSYNTAQGGAGRSGVTYISRGQRIATPGGRGGDGSGGGLFAADGAITLHDGVVAGNTASGGTGGAGGFGPPPGAGGGAGLARGGGLYIEVASSTRLDEGAFAHVANNLPSNIHGPFELVSNLMPADFDGDGAVDGDDFTQWRHDFGVNGLSDADADADHDSDGADFLAWQRQLGSGSPQTAAGIAVPEPTAATLSVAALLAAAMALRRQAHQQKMHRPFLSFGHRLC
jgi:hypothetical protein